MPVKETKIRILITDGASVNALGILRQLGILKKFEIYVVGYNNAALCKFSKYCKEFFLIPHPKSKSSEFISQIISICQKEKIDFLLPVGFYAHQVIIENIELVSHATKLCLPSKESFITATSKIETSLLAEKKGVLIPKTKSIANLNELDTLADLRFPVVIKSRNEIGGRMVEYANTKTDLISKFKFLVESFKLLPSNYPIIQEYIKGEGVGYFAFYKNGKVVRSFMHKRIREFPVSGGRSVCARSFYDEKLEKNGKLVLDALNWNGCAMVEFKRTSSNDYYLLEVNPKLWGSIELAICSGVNFPLFMINDALNIPEVKVENSYRKNLSFQWCLNGELYHFFNRPLSLFSIIKTAFTSKKDFWFKDIKPNLIQLLFIPVDFYKVIKSKIKS